MRSIIIIIITIRKDARQRILPSRAAIIFRIRTPITTLPFTLQAEPSRGCQIIIHLWLLVITLSGLIDWWRAGRSWNNGRRLCSKTKLS